MARITESAAWLTTLRGFGFFAIIVTLTYSLVIARVRPTDTSH